MRIHVIDFEGNLQCGIIEYGVVTLNDGEIEHTHTGFCRPDAPIQARDILVHGLRNEMLESFPSFAEHQGLFYSLRQSGVLAAHHAPVENMLLNRYWTVVPVAESLQELPASGGSWGPWIDSRLIAQRCCQAEDYSLGSLVQAFGLEPDLRTLATEHCPEDRRKPHCALYDALASALLLLHFRKSFNLDEQALIRCSQSRAESARGDYAQGELL